MGEESVEVNTLKQRVDFDGGLCGGGEGMLGTFTSSRETTEGMRVGGDILLILVFELLDKVVDEKVIKVLIIQVSVTSSGLDFKDTLLDGQKQHIEGSSSEIGD